MTIWTSNLVCSAQEWLLPNLPFVMQPKQTALAALQAALRSGAPRPGLPAQHGHPRHAARPELPAAPDRQRADQGRSGGRAGGSQGQPGAGRACPTRGTPEPQGMGQQRQPGSGQQVGHTPKLCSVGMHVMWVCKPQIWACACVCACGATAAAAGIMVAGSILTSGQVCLIWHGASLLTGTGLYPMHSWFRAAEGAERWPLRTM